MSTPPLHLLCHQARIIKKSAVDHTFYNTDSVLKTMELLLNIPPMNQYDAIANPILDFDTSAPSKQRSLCRDSARPRLFSAALPPRRPPARCSRLKSCATRWTLPIRTALPENVLNEVLWKSVKGVHSKMPAIRHSVRLLGMAKPAGADRSQR